MNDGDIGLLADTGRELYVADAISDLTRLRLHLASAPLAEIPARPEWGSIAASLRALGESRPAAVVDAFAQVLSSAGIASNDTADREFVSAGVDALDMLLRAGDGFDPSRLKAFIERVVHFCNARNVARPELPADLLDEARPESPATRSPFGTDPSAFELPPIDPPSWDFVQPNQSGTVGDPGADTRPAAMPRSDHDSHVTRVAVPVTHSWLMDRPEEFVEVHHAPPVEPQPPAQPAAVEAAATVPVAPAPFAWPEPVAPEPIQAPAPAFFERPAPALVEPIADAPLAQPDPVAELAARFDDVPVTPAFVQDMPAPAAVPAELARLAQGALWLADALGAGASPTQAAGATLDAIRRDALAMLAVELVVAVSNGPHTVRVGETASAQLRRLQEVAGAFDDFAIEGEWCRADLSVAGAAAVARAGIARAVPLMVTSSDGRRLWLPAQPERLSVWYGVSDDGVACVLPDLVADALPAGSPWHALKIAAGGRPETVAVAGSVPLPPGAPVLRAGSGAVVLDPTRWSRRRATCFALASSLDGLPWLAGAASLAGESAVLVDLATL